MSQPPSTQSVTERRTSKGNRSGQTRTNGRDHFAERAGAIIERTAVFVGALIAQRRQKAVEQISVRGVNLDHLRAGLQRSQGGVGKRPHDALDSRVIQFCRNDIARGKRQGTRRKDRPPAAIFFLDHMFPGFPGRSRARFPARVRELHPGNGALRFDEAKNPRQHFDVIVFPKSEVFRTDASFRQDGRCFRHDQRGAPDRATAEMDEVPVVGEAVGARILAHGRNADAVPQADVPQLERSKQMRRFLRQITHGVLRRSCYEQTQRGNVPAAFECPLQLLRAGRRRRRVVLSFGRG